MQRVIGVDIHRAFAEVVFWEAPASSGWADRHDPLRARGVWSAGSGLPTGGLAARCGNRAQAIPAEHPPHRHRDRLQLAADWQRSLALQQRR